MTILPETTAVTISQQHFDGTQPDNDSVTVTVGGVHARDVARAMRSAMSALGYQPETIKNILGEEDGI